MNDPLFLAWAIAVARILVPFGLIGWLSRRAVQLPPNRFRLRMLDARNTGPWRLPRRAIVMLTAGLRRSAGLRRAFAGITRASLAVGNLVLLAGAVAGTGYYFPSILASALDTPHPVATVSSSSMWPALKKGDVILLRGVNHIDQVTPGDVVAFEHQGGITVHRVIEVTGDSLATQGDANPLEDKPVQFSQVVGKLVTFRGEPVTLPRLGVVARIFGPLTSREDPETIRQMPAPQTEATSTPASQLLAGQSAIVSVRQEGVQLTTSSAGASVSADGRWVAFLYQVGNGQIHLYDAETKRAEHVSVNANGMGPNGATGAPVLSAGGRFIAFATEATNLAPGDENNLSDIYILDLSSGAMLLISRAANGVPANGASEDPAISRNGRFVAFTSAASNLVLGKDNGMSDVFVYDAETGAIEMVSAKSGGRPGLADSKHPSISADGRFVAFQSEDQIDIRDTNNFSDVFVRDRLTGVTERVSVAEDGAPGNGRSLAPSISADGRFVAFESSASNLVKRDFNRLPDVFVHDRETGVTERVSIRTGGGQANASSNQSAISGDGRFVAFLATDGNLVDADRNRRRDLFVHDRQTGETLLVSADREGQPSNDHSSAASLSNDGRVIAYPSLSHDIVEGDWNYAQDVFVRILEDTYFGGTDSTPPGAGLP
jgi:signal peptidase I